MMDPATAEWVTVDRPDAVKLCLSPQYAPVLEYLMLRESTVGAAAQALNMPVSAVFHRVRRLLAAGLVHVTQVQSRAGRPVQHYQAVSDAFLIPYRHTTLPTLEDLINLHSDAFQARLNRAAVHAGRALVENEDDIGLRIFRDGETVSFDVTPRAERFDFRELLRPDFPALLINWGELHLTREQAKVFQRELTELCGRHLAQSGPDRYLFRVSFAPDVPDDTRN